MNLKTIQLNNGTSFVRPERRTERIIEKVLETLTCALIVVLALAWACV